MSDDADKSQEREELENEIRKRYMQPVMEECAATGLCLNCGEVLDEGKRWCDAACRDDWVVWSR